MSDSLIVEPLPVTLCPHTHWDREWYEPFRVFSDRLVAMMDTLLDLTDEGFPHFHLDGQTAMVDDYLERRPEREGQLRRAAAAGRISLGPWVTQMDEFLTSGESHIRNLEMGLNRSRELGTPLEVGYMPDQFGHIGQMPQILAMFGIDRAMVWRGVPAEIESTSFLWRAPDGTQVLTEYMVFGYFNGERFHLALAPEELAGSLRRSVERLEPYRAGDRAIVMVGYDHAGPDGSLPARLAAARELVSEVEPEVGGIAAYLARQKVAENLPIWDGELRSSARAHLLPNVVSARVNQKLERGRIESLVERYAEPLAAQVPGFEWPGEELERIWKLMLWNGAHDSACGCSNDEVADDVDARFAEARGTAEAIVVEALHELGTSVSRPGLVRYNPSPFPREGVPANGWRVVETPREPGAGRVDIEALEDSTGVSIDGVPLRFFDEPDVGDLYNFCSADSDQVPIPPEELSIEGSQIEARWPGLHVAMSASRVEGESLVRLEGEIANRRPDHRLRLHVGLATRTDRSTAGAPFELVERPLVGEGGEGETPSPTWPARWFVLAGGRAVLHEGVFEYEVVGGRELAVTLLRCVGTISRRTLATRPFAAGPDVATPAAQMIGRASFELGLIAQAAPVDLLPAWERFALPILEAPAEGGGSLPPFGSFLAISGEVALSNIRLVGNRIQARLWNPFKDRAVPANIGGQLHEIARAKIVTVQVPKSMLDA